MDQGNFEAVLFRPQPTLQQLQSLVADLFTALNSTLNDERPFAKDSSVEDSLSRAAALLQTVAAPRAPAAAEPKGGLAPWQRRKVAAHIESNLDRSFRSCDLASLLRLSPAYFSRAFRKSFGHSPLEYVIRRRIERAQGLMLSTDLPLSRIALDCGLADQAHFSRLFRRVVGESPRAWRRAHLRAGGGNVAAAARLPRFGHASFGAAQRSMAG